MAALLEHRGMDDRAPLNGTSEDVSDNLAAIVGENLRRLRTRRGLSLERLSRASGVSRAMLSQIELGQSVPTINLLWKVARALGLPFSAFTTLPGQRGTIVLRADTSKVLASRDGRFTSRALFPDGGSRRAEFYELHVAVGTVEDAVPHPPGTVENLVVADGEIEIGLAGHVHRLRRGDAIQFDADIAHSYGNVGSIEARIYLVMTYATPHE
jgi:transcriptional regulator with XRE-family HTH domain